MKTAAAPNLVTPESVLHLLQRVDALCSDLVPFVPAAQGTHFMHTWTQAKLAITKLERAGAYEKFQFALADLNSMMIAVHEERLTRLAKAGGKEAAPND